MTRNPLPLYRLATRRPVLIASLALAAWVPLVLAVISYLNFLDGVVL